MEEGGDPFPAATAFTSVTADAPVSVTLPDPPTAALPLHLIDAVTRHAPTGELTVDRPLSSAQEAAILARAGEGAAKEAVRTAVNRRAGRFTGPARAGGMADGVDGQRAPFAVPVLALSKANSSIRPRRMT